jgi:hypothetical protein
MSRRLLSTMLVGLLVVACGTAQPSATPEPPIPTLGLLTPSPEPTAASTTTATAGPFDGLDYTLDLPEGWVIFDLTDPASAAALDDFVAANPDMAAAIAAFKSLPNVRMAVNRSTRQRRRHVLAAVAGPALETLAGTFTTQFAAVPGIKEVPSRRT